MIEVNHITKRFGKVTAVDDFTLDINRGSVLGIVGSNGGGKSTLLRILSGVFDADSGEVKINGQNIYNNPSVKGECFFIPDFPYFSNSATVFTRIGTRTLSDNFAPCFLLTLMQK